MVADAECDHSEGTTIETSHSNGADRFLLTDDHRMLLQIRDTLYEGSWEDFIRDLEARAAGRPHVFELVPASDKMKATIAGHLRMISDMREWEAAQGRPLRPNERTPAGSS
jgi:hypothetical protein